MKVKNVLSPLASVGIGVMLASTLVACGDDESPSGPQNTNNATMGAQSNNGTSGSNNSTTTSTNNETSGTNNGTTTGTNNETQACEPLDQLACVTCGMLDDGCGGTLDCGACPCVEGVPTSSACGACDIGTTVCGVNETGFGGCEMPIPGIASLTCEDMVFVAGGLSGGDGSKTSPYTDVLVAVAGAKSSGKRLIVVEGDGPAYSLDGPLELADGIHIIGGFGNGFIPSPSNRPIISNDSADVMTNVFAARAINIQQATHLKNVELRTKFSAAPGGNTFGLWAENANGLVLTNVALRPGRGGVGTAGVDGADGAKAQDALVGVIGNYRVNEGQPYPLQSGVALGGLGCDAASGGGRGGRGAGYSSSANPTVLMAATSGTRIGGGGGGAGGASNTGGSPGTSGVAGAAGNVGAMAVDGLAGDDFGVMDPVSFFVRQANGADGEAGGHGFGGSGGGGAGAYDRHTGGPSGGGGGGGGCGGDAGTGGMQGGSSFALILRSSPGLSYSNLELIPGPGGQGAEGGQGGEGGAGGIGGSSSTTLLWTYGNMLKQSLLLGGRGGDGGKGARGGHGGGGAGGHSIAVWCDGAYDISAMTKTPSPSGAGGLSYNPANNGAQGRSSADYGCNEL